MKVNIIKGTNQIGGCITEITSDSGTSILIDYGKDLEEKEDSYYLELDFSKYSAVFITHIHDDHIGLIDLIPENVLVYVEEVSYELYRVYQDFVLGKKARKVETFKLDCEGIIVKDMKITPKKVDHSSFNSVMYLVEADGKKVLHLGDFRSNGSCGKELAPTLKEIGSVDMLIMEGTTLSREEKHDSNGKLICNDTEDELAEKITEVMKKYKFVMILQSSLNIDRVRTMYKACKKSGKVLAEDIFTAVICGKLEHYDENDYDVPNPTNEKYNVRVYVPQNRDEDRNHEFRSPELKRVYEEYIAPLKDNWLHYDIKYKDLPVALIVKTSWNDKRNYLRNELERFKRWGKLEDACLIYSMWDGYRYMEDNSTKVFVDEVENKYKIPVYYLHTSGHADSRARDIVFDNLEYKQLLPIHTVAKEKYKDFKNIVMIEDGEEVVVG